MFQEGPVENKPANLIETTDCLEAVGVFRCWKNFLFAVLLLGLIALQLIFWCTKLGFVPEVDDTTVEVAAVEIEAEPAIVVDEPVVDEQKTTAEDAVAQAAAQTVADANVVAKAEVVEEAQAPEAKTQKRFSFPFKLKRSYMMCAIKCLNFVLIFAGILYCLSLLFALKVSLIGRLGGINHIARGFFFSLVFVVILLPWQVLFGAMSPGVLYRPDELFAVIDRLSDGILDNAVLYARFVVYWLIAIVLLFLAQMRSAKWARAILRRLEVV
jgi:hypothetical protein